MTSNKELETKMHTLECAVGVRLNKLEAKVKINDIRVNNLIKEKTEIVNKVGQLETKIKEIDETEAAQLGTLEEQIAITLDSHKNVTRSIIDCTQFFLINLCSNTGKSASFENIRENTFKFHKHSTEVDRQESLLSSRYWSTNETT